MKNKVIKELMGLRAVFYARVSTEEEMQVNALAKQIQENRDVIKEKGWILVDEYIDEGKSGTKIKGRNEYQRLLDDLEADKFDIIVIKSQDRLQRNTKDWYVFIDRLVTNEKKLYMYLEGAFYSTDNALITGIKAILAEEYSRDLSKKLNNSNQRRIDRVRKGEEVSAMGTNMAYGHYIKDGKWVVDPEQAEVVKKVYELYKKRNSLRKVCRELNELGYRNQKGTPFLEDSVRRIIRNERNMGVNVVNRYHRDFDTKKIVKLPKEEWVYQEGACEPIISKEEWKEANDRMDSKVGVDTKGKMRGRGTGSDPLSGKMFCASCGKVLWKHKSNGYTNWFCSGNYGKGATICDNPCNTSTVALRRALKEVSKDLVVNKKAVKKSMLEWLEKLKADLSDPVDNSKVLADLSKAEKRKSKLTEAYMDEIISKEDYRVKYKDLEEKILSLKSKLVPVEENEDLKEVEAVIKDIDNEIEAFITAPNFEDSKIDFLIEHTKRIFVCENKHYVIELDIVGGAIIAGESFLAICNGTDALSFTNGKYKVEFKIVA